MFSRILISIGLFLASASAEAWPCLLGTGTDSGGNLITSISMPAISISSNLPDGTIISEIDVGVGVADPTISQSPCWLWWTNGVAPSLFAAGANEPVTFYAEVTPPNGSWANPASYAHPGSYNTFYPAGIPGIYYEVSENGSLTTQSTFDTNAVVAAQGSNSSGQVKYVTCTINQLLNCSNVASSTLLNQHQKLGTIWYHLRFMKYAGSTPLTGGSYSLSGNFFNVILLPQQTTNAGWAGNVSLNSTLSITIASTCSYDINSMNAMNGSNNTPSNLPGNLQIPVNFGVVPDQGGPGSQIGNDQKFWLDFSNCGSSPIPNVKFSTYNSDSPDSQGNFPVYSPNADAANKVNTGLGFQVIDMSGPSANVLTPNGQFVGITAPGAVGGVYPSTTNNVTWPFIVRLIKNTTASLQSGPFEGKANFMIQYK